MRTLRHCWVAANLFTVLVFPSIALADTIRITSGTVELGGAFDLVGNESGFRLSGSG